MGIEDVIEIKLATNTKIKVHGTEELKAVAKAVAGSLSELDFLLALNCGMYEADIGRLMLNELDLVEGSVFWDREKQPANEFRVHHLFWPETLIIVKKYLHDGTVRNEYEDFRNGKASGFTHNTAGLAFLDGNAPTLPTLITETGAAGWQAEGLATLYAIEEAARTRGARWTSLRTGPATGVAIPFVGKLVVDGQGQHFPALDIKGIIPVVR